MQKLLLALASVAAVTVPAVSHAEDANPLSFNLSVTSDYRFRGISQSRLDPALQGGVDYALPKGFYIGAWASSIHWIKDAGRAAGVDTGSAPLELDLYGGYKGEITKDWTYDVGVLQYVYPSNHLSRISNSYNPNTTELYGALTYGPATVKYSYATSRLFGFANSHGSGYLEAAASFDVGYGITLTPHVGHQYVKNNSDYSYTDYSLTAAKDYWGFTFSAAVVGTDTHDVGANPGGHAYYTPSGKDLGRTGLVVAVKKTF